MIRPLISVCIATYNGEKFIVEQLKTILSQLTDFDEIIISDDHSSDCTLSLIRSFRDPRIKIYLNENDKGYTSNFENALKKATGEIIFIADQDDIWKKDKVDISLNYLKKYDFIVSDACIIDNSGNFMFESYIKQRNSYVSFWDNWIFLIAASSFSYKIIPEKLICYRRHLGNTSTGGLKNNTSLYFKMKYRIYLIWHLLKRKLEFRL